MIDSPELGFAFILMLPLAGFYFAYKIGVSVGNERATARILDKLRDREGAND